MMLSIKNSQPGVGFRLSAVQRMVAGLEGFDQIAEVAAAWDTDFRLLGSGSGSGVIEAISTGQAVVQRNRFSWSLHQHGVAPRGFRTFGVGATEDQRLRWNGHTVESDWILSFPCDGSFESVSDGTFHVYSLSYDDDLVRNTVQLLGLPPVSDLLPAAGDSRRSPGFVRHIRQTLLGIIRASRQIQMPNSGGHAGLARVIEWDLLSQLLSGLAAGRPAARPEARLRSRALRRCTAFIEQSAGRPITVRELCEVSGASWRTLDYAFKEQFGLSPKAYLRAHRLNGVRAQLLDLPEHGGTIAMVAGRWGFWHMSQFAVDYRKLFGELPSETRRERSRSV